MRKAMLLAACIFGCARLAQAQDNGRKVEFFGGYSYLNTDLAGWVPAAGAPFRESASHGAHIL